MKKTRKQAVVRAAKAAVVMGMLPLAMQVQALEFQLSEDAKLDVDTTLTYGAQWRVEGRSKNKIGLTAAELNALSDPNQKGTDDYSMGAQKINGDDGDRNFDKGDLVANRVAGISDIQFTYKNVGFFLRPQIYYDSVPFGRTHWSGKYLPENSGKIYPADCPNASATAPDGTPLRTPGSPCFIGSTNNSLAAGEIDSTANFDKKYQNTLGYTARFLDAYAYGSFAIGDRELQVRLGRQSINWGEALMLPGGIGFAINRLDASAATAPGVELKEMFLPTGALYGQMNVTESNTIEAYWQYEFLPSIMTPTGSFFSTADMMDSNAFIADPINTTGLPGSWQGMSRRVDHDPGDANQWGLAFRHLMEDGGEMGFYVVNYTDKFAMPFITNGTAAYFSSKADYDAYRAGLPNDPYTDPADPTATKIGEFGMRYFDDIRLYGLTLNTVFNGVQVGVEYAFRANHPVIPFCSLQGLANGECKDNSYTAIAGQGGLGLDPNDPAHAAMLNNFKNASVYSWANRAEVHTLDIGITYIFQPNAYWDNAILVGELGGFYVGGYDNHDLRFAHLGGFTKYGEGITAQFMPEYKNVMEGVDLTVPFFFNYGIDGSMSTFNYNEHALWTSIGLEAVYLEHWRFATYYNRFSGKHSMWEDRDNVSFNVKYIF